MKNYYRVFGLGPEADSEEIKRAYKELAKKFHPDTTNEEGDTTAAFSEITEAYEILGSPESRARYDRQRRQTFFSGAETPGDRKARAWEFNGVPSPEGPSSPSATRSHSATVKVPLRLAVGGGEVHVTGLPGGMYVVSVPAGTSAGSVAIVETPQGQFKIRLVIEDDPPFFLKGNSIEMPIRLNLAQAVLGMRKELSNPAGIQFSLEIPAGVQPGAVFRIPGKGLAGGDLVIRVEIEIPRDLGSEERSLFARFAKKAGLQL